ncbi:MAG: DUF302 domain-containing protein [Actinobacteria bacterium]|nr:DUF302 domain-containing protein [Actinomycetota bacterium]
MASLGSAITLESDFDTTLTQVTDALAEQGFGIITEIDVQATMKNKLDVDRPPYRILGACNPVLANSAINSDPSIGLLLPCNVVVRYEDDQHTVVEFIDPQIMVQLTESPGMVEVAADAGARLTRAQNTLTS